MKPSYITHQDLVDKFKNRTDSLLLDVRNPKDFAFWNIYQSVNVPIQSLSQHVKSLEKDRDIITICTDGTDAKNAASFLTNSGFKAHVLKGGLKGWNSIYDIVRVFPSKQINFTVYQVKRLGKGCLSYVIVLQDGESAVIVDPTFHLDIYLDFVKKNDLKVVAVMDTHIHNDHISGGLKLAKKLHAKYLLSEKSKTKFSYQKAEKVLPKLFGEKIVKIIDTPGHTDESISMTLGKSFVFTGDAIFLDRFGRADFHQDLEDKAKLLHHSLHKKIFALHDDIYVLPAHTTQAMVPGPSRAATLRYVKRFNIAKKHRSKEKFLKAQKSNSAPAPCNMEKISELNRNGVLRLKDDLEDLELGHSLCAVVL